MTADVPMNVLAINCGSSSIKWGLFEVSVDGRRGPSAPARARGRIKSLGSAATLHLAAAGVQPLEATKPVPNHGEYGDDMPEIRDWTWSAG